MPFFFCSSESSSSTCDWMVTSTAVVGSSAMRRSGPAASAIAIMARCLRPPESWKGYSSARRAASGMPTESSNSRMRRSSAAPRKLVWRSSTSRIWVPMREDRIQARRRLLEDHRDPPPAHLAHRAFRKSEEVDSLKARPAPETTPLSGSRRMSESAVIVFPQPDSPTMAKVSPRRISRSTPSTARTGSRAPCSTVLRFSALSSTSCGIKRDPPRPARGCIRTWAGSGCRRATRCRRCGFLSSPSRDAPSRAPRRCRG